MTGRPSTMGMESHVWAANPFLTIEFFLTVGLLIAVLLGGAVVFFFVDRWRKRQLSPGHESTETLSTFRAMFERGELTEAEYRKVRDRVAARMREEVLVPQGGIGSDTPLPSRPLGPPSDTQESPPSAGAIDPPPKNPPD